jgi:3-dehydroquinate synthase
VQTVDVDLGTRAYSVWIGPAARLVLSELSAARGRGPAASGPRRIAVITDETVAKLHLEAVLEALRAGVACRETPVLTVAPGEDSKSPEVAAGLYQALAEARIDRSDLIVTLGGGVVGDVGGFVAATWHRGLPLIQVPTTLEAAIDASVGGKTALNLPAGKNLVGVFHQPVGVVIDTDFLATLPQRDFVAGLAESVKHAAISGEALLAWHERHADATLARDPAVLVELIARNCRIKAEVVARDEREFGLRSILNYGHTVGHAIEYLLGYDLRHGECVALGMIVAGELSCRQAGLDPAGAERIKSLIARLGLPTRLPRPVDSAEIAEVCCLDKKARSGALQFVLLQAIGHPLWSVEVAEPDLADATNAVNPGGPNL